MDELLPVGPDLAPGVWWFALAWVTFVGACVGSFLNVVIYRVPAGLSIVHPPSHCPACGHPIRWYDNIPVASWLILHGKCRDCGVAISWRYPLVEAVTAAMFAVLAVAEPLSGGEWLPHAPQGTGLWGLFLLHATLCAGLLVIAGIEMDRPIPGTRPIATTTLVCLVLGAVWPENLVLVRSVDPLAEPGWRPHLDGLGSALLGLMFGFCLTLAAMPTVLRVSVRLFFGHLASLPLIGAVLGWEAVGVVALGVAILDLGTRVAIRRWPGIVALPPSVWTCACAVGLIAAGRNVTDLVWIQWLGDTPWGPLATVFFVCVLSVVATFLHHRAVLSAAADELSRTIVDVLR